MINFFKGKKKGILMIVALALVVGLYVGVFPLHASETCERALVRCSVDAVVSLFFSGPSVFGLYSTGCLLGYAWCLKYYV